MPISNLISAQTYNEEHAPRPIVASLPEMVVTAVQYEKRMNDVKQFVREQMVDGVDYGVIPRTPKPTLFKPGAEKLLAVFGLATRYETTHRIENLFDKTPFILYEVKVTVECKRSSTVIAEGLGACNSRERKYLNQDVANVANTVLKMAKKRALIDATLLATRTSGLFQSGDTDETNNSSSPDDEAQAPRPHLRSVPPEIATLEQIKAANNWRTRAVKAGYRTATDDAPKPIAEGETVRNVRARYEKWKAFVETASVDAKARELAEEIGEPNLEAEDLGPQTIEAKTDPRGQRYEVPGYYPPRNCKSCSAPLAFITTENGKEMPIDTRGENRGYPHWAVCSKADEHRKPRAPKTVAVEGETAYAEAKPTPKMSKHLAHLWAVASANDLKSEPRDQRIDNANQVLMDHQIDAVESWNDLTPVGA